MTNHYCRQVLPCGCRVPKPTWFFGTVQGGVRYHQALWKRAPRPRGMKQIFNRAHSSLRSVIEQSFGMVKMKWRILLGLPHYSERKQAQIILACCALHNFILENDNDDLHYHMDDADDSWDIDDVDEDTGHDAVEGDEDDMNELRDEIAAGWRMAEHASRV